MMLASNDSASRFAFTYLKLMTPQTQTAPQEGE